MDKREFEQSKPFPSEEDSSDSCPICLAPMLQDSYLDNCFHKFCFKCIVQWTKVVVGKDHSAPTSVKCPLCKRENSSIIYGYDGSSFQRHYVYEDDGNSFVLTRSHRYRLQCYYAEPGILDNVFSISQYWKSRKYYQSNCWLQKWLRREIQALVQEEDVDIIMQHIYGVICASLTWTERKACNKTPGTKQEEFRAFVSDAARPFLGARTNRFTYEVELFLASGLNMEAYDAVYLQRLGWSSSIGTSEASENESAERTSVIPYLYIFDENSDGY